MWKLCCRAWILFSRAAVIVSLQFSLLYTWELFCARGEHIEPPVVLRKEINFYPCWYFSEVSPVRRRERKRVKRACTMHRKILHRSSESIKILSALLLELAWEIAGKVKRITPGISVEIFQSNSFLMFPYHMELWCENKWIYHHVCYHGRCAVHHFIITFSLQFPLKCWSLMPSFLIPRVESFSAQLCSTALEVPPSGFCALFHGEPLNRVDLTW